LAKHLIGVAVFLLVPLVNDSIILMEIGRRLLGLRPQFVVLATAKHAAA
jgi:hypothetical protein